MYAGTSARSPAGSFEVSVLIQAIPQALYRRGEDGKIFVAGEAGRPYTLRVRNLLPDRIEVLSTVDGRNTLKDEPGSLSASHGLVFSAMSEGEFAGWRLNDEEVREFVFGEPSHSVAAMATGSQDNVGVIGLAAYREHIYRTPYARLRPGGQSVAVGAAAAALDMSTEVTRGLGTGIGEQRADHVGRTTFTRHGPADILAIGYDTREALAAQGILGPREPDPFPGETTGYEKYVQ